jgi:molybdate transport system substrate-binding protein
MLRRALLISLLSGVFAVSAIAADPIRVGVAVSLKEAATDIGKAFESETGGKVEFSFGSSGQIMAQIKSGAPIDVFISAASKQVDELKKERLVDPGSERVIAGNTLVLIVPRDSDQSIDSFEALRRADIKRLAVGEPKTVPAGHYALQVLDKLKLTAVLKDKLIYGSNVRQVLDYVSRREVTAGIVYATDAKQAGDKVKVVAKSPRDTHEPIVYPATIVKRSRDVAGAKKFLDYFTSDRAKKILEDHGFTTPEPKPAEPAGPKK